MQAEREDTGIGEVAHLERGKDLLRFMTCGSVDDGKSTLIGRLLLDLGQVLDDQLVALEGASEKHGTTSGELDPASLLDGLLAEREQGITIDVAYRYFSTRSRKFIVADAPGHEQYTRNMATAASVSELAVILVDARKGVLTQTRRHTIIAHLLGVRHVILAVNKMDLVAFDESRFAEIRAEYERFALRIGVADVRCVPVAALSGDNIVKRSARMSWYDGPTLVGHLEAVDARSIEGAAGLAMAVQWVNRPHADFRGFSGTIASGSVKRGDGIVVLPAATTSRIRSISTYDGERASAEAGEAVTLVLEDDIDVSRGDVIASAADRPEVTDQFAAHLIWLGNEPMLPGRPYRLKCATQSATASVTTLKHKVNVDTLEKTAGRQLALNDICVCNLSLSRLIVFRPYDQDRTLGAFILIDKISNQTVGAGMIRFGLGRAANVHWQSIDIDRGARARQKGQKPFCLWFTGLSGSGKSTIANALDRRLYGMGHHVYILDGDNVRHGLNRDLGFTDAERVENVRRVTEVARLMIDAGLITIVSFISPFRAERQLARDLFGEGEYLEVYVSTSLAICELRDAKGLYRRARAGEIKNFTGIDSAYEPPEAAEFEIDGGSPEVERLVDRLINGLHARGLI